MERGECGKAKGGGRTWLKKKEGKYLDHKPDEVSSLALVRIHTIDHHRLAHRQRLATALLALRPALEHVLAYTYPAP